MTTAAIPTMHVPTRLDSRAHLHTQLSHSSSLSCVLPRSAVSVHHALIMCLHDSVSCTGVSSRRVSLHADDDVVFSSSSSLSSHDDEDGGQKSRGVWVQGLQGAWRRSSSRETSQPHIGRAWYPKRRYRVCGNVRMSRRVWLRPESGRRRQDCQSSQGRSGSFESTWSRRGGRRVGPKCNMAVLVLGILLVLCSKNIRQDLGVEGFGVELLSRRTMTRQFGRIQAVRMTKECSNDASEEGDDGIGDGDQDAPSVMIDDLSWRVAKLRLEEANTRRFLKSRPRYLPYEECCKWVQAWDRWDNEQDWKDWIDMGEKRNSYVPARPDEYYGRLGKWRSWEHFLGKVSGDEEEDETDRDTAHFD